MGRDCGFCHIVEVDLPLHLSLAPLEFANHLNRKKILLFPCRKKKPSMRTLNPHRSNIFLLWALVHTTKAASQSAFSAT